MNRTIAYFATAVFVAVVFPAVAQEKIRTIEVTGAGAAKILPDTLAISVVLKADAKDAKTASEELAKLKDKFTSDINSMTYDNLELEFGGPQFTVDNPNSMAMMMGGGGMPMEADEGEKKISGSEEISLELTDLQEMDAEEIETVIADLTDKLKAHGITFSSSGQQNMVMVLNGMGSNNPNKIGYRLTEKSDTENEALKNAMEDAKEKAKFLATLAGGELGNVVSISVFSEAAAADAKSMVEMMYGSATPEVDPLSSPTYSEIEIKKSLRVTFELK